MNIPLESILLIIAGFINFAFGMVVYLRNRISENNIYYGLISFFVFLWALSLALFVGTSEINIFTKWASTMMHISAALIPIAFLFFSTTFDEKEITLSKRSIFFIMSSCILLILFILIPDVILESVTKNISNNERVINFGPAYPIYGMYIVYFFALSFYKLIRKYLKTNSLITKVQIKYIIAGTFLASFIGVMTNLVLPFFGDFNLYWLGPVTTVFMVVAIGYAIARYNLWDFKLIMVQLFIFFLVIISLFDIIFANSSPELIFKSFTFAIVVTISIVLVRKITKEADAKEEIEKLAENLKLANKQLKKMDKQKSEFVSIASHQLRAPIAALKGYSSMILEGSYGRISKDVEGVIEKLFQSSQSLSLIIDDFLNLSRIERGKIEYCFSEGDIEKVLGEALTQITPIVKDKGLKMKINIEENNYSANMDSEKIRQIIINLIDNAIKYTPEGFVNVNLSKKNSKILFEVADSGIGIPKDQISKLFKKFSRLDNANEANIKGTGLGLYLAKQITEAHKGKIWAESKGKNKGTSFFIEFKGI